MAPRSPTAKMSAGAPPAPRVTANSPARGRTSVKRPLRGKLWANDELLFLAKAWQRVALSHADAKFKVRAREVYDEYVRALCCAKRQLSGQPYDPTVDTSDALFSQARAIGEGGLDVLDEAFRPRSLRAIEDKLGQMKHAYLVTRSSGVDDESGTGRVRVTMDDACFEVLRAFMDPDSTEDGSRGAADGDEPSTRLGENGNELSGDQDARTSTGLSVQSPTECNAREAASPVEHEFEPINTHDTSDEQSELSTTEEDPSTQSDPGNRGFKRRRVVSTSDSIGHALVEATRSYQAMVQRQQELHLKHLAQENESNRKLVTSLCQRLHDVKEMSPGMVNATLKSLRVMNKMSLQAQQSFLDHQRRENHHARAMLKATFNQILGAARRAQTSAEEADTGENMIV